MFNTTKNHDSGLEVAIDNALKELSGHEAHSEEYASIVDQLTSLYALKESPSRVSKDTLVAVAGNLAGILLIINYEQRHVVASKALGFVGKFAK
jgi:exopolyphosphatase/pppGpp-phosphohydrolase